MTPSDTDVATLIRRQARIDEPAFGLSPEVLLASAHRHVRERRISLGLRAAAVVAAIACVAGVPAPADGSGPGAAAAPLAVHAR